MDRTVSPKLDWFCVSFRSVFIFSSFIPPYGSTVGILSLLCVCHFVCTVTDFPAAEKDRSVKFCTCIGLLSRQVFSLLVNFGSRGVTGAAAYFRDEWLRRINCVGAWHGHSELGAAALLKAVWWDLCLASLLTHWFSLFFLFLVQCGVHEKRANWTQSERNSRQEQTS